MQLDEYRFHPPLAFISIGKNITYFVSVIILQYK